MSDLINTRHNDFCLCPITLKTARDFIRDHHRHNAPPQGYKFAIGLIDTTDTAETTGAAGTTGAANVEHGEYAGRLVGVVIVGHPIARGNCDGYTAEVTRCCVLEEQRNANSRLYAAALRVARAMGYRRVITYTLPEESGASLRAVGFAENGRTVYRPWNTPTRPHKMPDKYPVGEKIRWIKIFDKRE